MQESTNKTRAFRVYSLLVLRSILSFHFLCPSHWCLYSLYVTFTSSIQHDRLVIHTTRKAFAFKFFSSVFRCSRLLFYFASCFPMRFHLLVYVWWFRCTCTYGIHGKQKIVFLFSRHGRHPQAKPTHTLDKKKKFGEKGTCCWSLNSFVAHSLFFLLTLHSLQCVCPLCPSFVPRENFKVAFIKEPFEFRS